MDAYGPIIDNLEAQRAQQAEEYAKLPPGPDRDKVLEAYKATGDYLATVKKYRDAASESLATYQANLEQAENDADVINATFEEAAKLAPPSAQPYIALAGLGIALIGSIVRQVQTGQKAKTAQEEADTAKKVIVAVEKAKTDGVVNFADPETAKSLTLEMGAAGKALVDQIQGKV